MRFVDFLRVTVMLSAAAASLLAVLCLIGGTGNGDDTVILASAGWWVIAAAIGLWLGRRAAASPPIARLLADAKAATMMPEHRPGFTIINRLWVLLVATLVASALAFLVPQAAGIGAGFAIIWTLAWRRQDAAVQAIEERDGVTFYVDRTSPLSPMQLVRIPGFRREVPSIPTPG